MNSRPTRPAVLAACGAAVLLCLAAAAGAQRFLPGPLEAIPDLRIEVRRPLGFKPDPEAPTDVHTIERLRGGHSFRGAYRHWFFTLRRHVGFSDGAHLRKAWEAYLGGEKSGWKLTFLKRTAYDTRPGLIAYAVPGDAATKGLVVSGTAELGGGRLLEARLDVMKAADAAVGIAFVDDFLRNARLDPDYLGPRRFFPNDRTSVGLPKGWIVSQSDGDLRFTARHPDGARRAAIEWQRMAREASDPEAALRSWLGDAPLARAPRRVDHVREGIAWLAVTAEGRVRAVVRQGDTAIRVDAGGRDADELEKIVVRVLLSLRARNPELDKELADERIRSLRAAMKARRKGEAEALTTLNVAVHLMDLPAVRAAVKKALTGGTPRVAEAAARAFAARADNHTTPILTRAVRKVIRRNQPVLLAALYRGLGRAGRPAALPILEAGLRQAHPVAVIAAVEGLRAPYGKPQKAFGILTGYWEQLETWATERPQLKDQIAYDALVRTLRANLKSISGREFSSPGAARTWFGANRRHVKPR